MVPVTVAVPGGRFVMGSATGRPDESPPHPVTVRAFRLARTPVTHAQYARFVEKGGAPRAAEVSVGLAMPHRLRPHWAVRDRRPGSSGRSISGRGQRERVATPDWPGRRTDGPTD